MRRFAEILDDIADLLEDIKSLPSRLRDLPGQLAAVIYGILALPGLMKAAPGRAGNAAKQTSKGAAVGLGDIAVLAAILIVLDFVLLGGRKSNRGA